MEGATKFSHANLIGIMSACLVIFGSIIVFSTRKSDSTASYTSFSSTMSGDIVFTFGRVNYQPLPYFNGNTAITSYKHLEGYVAVIEPSSKMELQFYDESLYMDGFKYYFKICPTDNKESCQEGYKYKSSDGNTVSGQVSFTCELFSTFEIEVVQADPVTEEVTRTATGKGLCQYVRREIRDMTDDDVTRFMEASHKLSTTTEEEGQSKYGAKFHTDSTLLRFHHFNAGQQDADHVHEGNGFLTQHLKFTNMFEASLQAVDSSVYLPYWDFTVDDALHHTVSNSVIVDEKLYGAMHFPKDIMKGFSYKDDRIADGVIKSGRWAYLKAEMNTAFPDLNYGYGYMRAPWSMNPSPYISRFTSVFNQLILLPTCDMHHSILQNYDDMMDFFNAMAYEPHATIHTLAGGIYGCDLLLPMVAKGYLYEESGAYGVCKGWTFNLKEWFRKNYITPRSNCVVNATHLESSRCGFDCVEENKASLSSFILSSVSKYGNVEKAGAEEAWLDFICVGGDGGRIFPGDHLESASPADPSFWVIHPTLERLLQAKLMAGGFRTENWHTDPVKEYVCNKAKCYRAAEDRLDYFEDCCYGHFENDRLLDAFSGDTSSYYGPTNKEVVAGTDPRSAAYNMPYIYDKFTWTHCDQDFDGLLASLVKKASEPAVAVDTSKGKKTVATSTATATSTKKATN